MRNYIQPGETITVPSPANVLSGEPVAIGELIGVAAGDAATGADLDIATVGVFDLPKVAALAIGIGDVLYLDAAAKLVSKTASGNIRIGVAVTVAANPSASVHVRLG